MHLSFQAQATAPQIGLHAFNFANVGSRFLEGAWARRSVYPCG
jgi:hypothetical protein